MGIDPATRDLIFYSAPFSRANRHFPIGNLDKWTVHTVTTAKTFEDVVTTVTVPWFDGWDVVNLIKNTQTGYVYWVTASSVSTLSSKSVAFELLYNAPTSILKAGDSLTGVWDRLPTNECPYLKETIGDDAVRITSATDIPKITPYGDYTVCWYEIVTRGELSMTSPPPTHEKIIRYGGFAIIPYDDTNRETLGVIYSLAPSAVKYPTLHDIMNEFNKIADNASPDMIVSINVSLRCPYKYMIDGFGNRYSLIKKGTEDVPIHPTVLAGTNAKYCLHYLEKLPELPEKWSETVTIDLTEDEMKTGEVNIISENNNLLANIPIEHFRDGTLTFTVETTTDYTGIYTDIIFDANRIRIPETKLPWTGNSWAEYQVRSMDSDRASMNLAISTAREQRNIDAIGSLSNAAMGGAVGHAMGGPVLGGALSIATAATGIVGAELQGRLSERTARAEQEIKENYQKSQLSNNFNTAYGMMQLIDNNSQSIRITVSTPVNIDSEYMASWFNEFGYRVQGVRTHTLQTGRYQGRLTSLPKNGVKGDLLNAEFIEGVKIEIVPDDVFEVIT